MFIFGPNNGIPLTTANRLQRWSYFLAGFTYQIEYIKSSENGNCDALSRLPIPDETIVFENDLNILNYIENCLPIISQKMIKTGTLKCVILQKIARYVRDGWPPSNSLAGEEKEYHKIREELSLENGCIMRGTRVVIPLQLRGPVLQELHESHPGIVKMKMLARSYIWWPALDADAENAVKGCIVCTEEGSKPEKVPLTPWPWPERPWVRVHSDFLGPFHGRMFMIVLDAHSKWPEVFDMGNNTTAERVIEALEDLYIRHGYPKLIVTDCGRQYASEEFGNYCKKRGISQSFSPPYHPATNGAAENFVRTFKSRVTKIVKGGKPLKEAVRLFLFDYRSTPHSTTNRSPASLMYQRELRTRFSLMQPDVEIVVLEKQQQQVNYRGGDERCLKKGTK